MRMAARAEKVLDSARREMTIAEIRDAVAAAGASLAMGTVRLALAREARRPDARIVRVRRGIYAVQQAG